MKRESFLSPADFPDRHCGLSAADEKKMAEALGLSSRADIRRAYPPDVDEADFSDLPPPLSERLATEALRRIAEKIKSPSVCSVAVITARKCRP